MNSSGIAVVGAGGHAKVVVDAIRASGREVAGVVAPDATAASVFGATAYATADALVQATGAERFVVAIGDNFTRWRVATELLGTTPAVELVSVVHPSAVVAPGVELGPGAMVLAGVVVNPGSVVGAGVILNTACSIDHDARIGDYASVAPGAVLGGNVAMGERASVSLGASVIHGRTIGRDAVVGAGAVVLEDVPDGVVAYGVPARAVRERRPDEKYL